MNFGADITINPHIVSTTRFGYYFENYHDFGYPTSNTLIIWETAGHCRTDRQQLQCLSGARLGNNPLPASLQQVAGNFNDPYSQFYTKQNSNKAIQFDQDLAFFKSGWGGTHNFKFGYQLNRLQEQHLARPTANQTSNCSWDESATTPRSAGTGLANCAGQFFVDSGHRRLRRAIRIRHRL